MRSTQMTIWHSVTKRRWVGPCWTWRQLRPHSKTRAAGRAPPSISRVSSATKRSRTSYSTISGHSMRKTGIRLRLQRLNSKRRDQVSLTLMKLAHCHLRSHRQRRNLGINQLNHRCITMLQISKRVVHKGMRRNSLEPISWIKDLVLGIEWQMQLARNHPTILTSISQEPRINNRLMDLLVVDLPINCHLRKPWQTNDCKILQPIKTLTT